MAQAAGVRFDAVTQIDISSDLLTTASLVPLTDLAEFKQPIDVESYGVDVALFNQDPYFSFRARHEGYDATGAPFTRVRMTVGLRVAEGGAGAIHRPLAVTIAFPFTRADGTKDWAYLPASTQTPRPGDYVLTIDAVGTDSALLIYRQLKTLHAAQIHLALGDSRRAILPLGATYADALYSERFRISTQGGDEVLADETQIQSSGPPAKPMMEIASLRDAYPSFGKIFYSRDQLTAVLVPKAYGIFYDSDSTAVRCDASVRLYGGGPEEMIQFRFRLAPLISEVDTASIGAEIVKTTGVQSGIHVRLASTLDGQQKEEIQLPVQADLALTEDVGTSHLLLSVTLRASGAFSAVQQANKLLVALTRGNVALFGRLYLRVGAGVQTAEEASLLLDFEQTACHSSIAGRSDLICSLDAEKKAVQIRNAAKVSVFVSRMALAEPSQTPHVREVMRSLSAGSAMSIDNIVGATVTSSLLVDRKLDVTLPLSAQDLNSYISFDASTEDSSEITISIDSGPLDFKALKIARLRGHVVPLGLNAPSKEWTLTETDRSLDMTYTIPIQAALRGFAAVVSVTVEFSTLSKTVSIRHDFGTGETLFLSLEKLTDAGL